jgi:hypothetical protein
MEHVQSMPQDQAAELIGRLSDVNCKEAGGNTVYTGYDIEEALYFITFPGTGDAIVITIPRLLLPNDF